MPEIISKEPLAPAVRQGDDSWEDLARWTHKAMVDAEELGVTQQNVDEMVKSNASDVRRLLSVEGQFGESLGLTNDWAYRIIKAVGNYGESFERNVGQGSPLKIAWGLNGLWTKGGRASRSLSQAPGMVTKHGRSPRGELVSGQLQELADE